MPFPHSLGAPGSIRPTNVQLWGNDVSGIPDSLKQIFVAELDEQVEALESGLLKLEKNPGDEGLISEIFRYSHNIKGSSAAVGLTELAGLAHAAESLMSQVKNHHVKLNDEILGLLLRFVDALKDSSGQLKKGDIGGGLIASETAAIRAYMEPGGKGQASAPAAPVTVTPPVTPAVTATVPEPAPAPVPQPVVQPAPASSAPAEEFIKISARKVDRLIELFGEQVILQSTLDHAMEDAEPNEDLARKSVTELRKITRALQHGVVTLRMIPASPLVKRLERAVRDAAKITGKDIDFEVVGENAEIDKTILDAIANPLTHLVRNAVDHGIEGADARAAAGKPARGKITLSFKRTGGAIDICVQDDGGGLNKDKILAKAVKMGLVQANRQYTDGEIHKFIFMNGFSTNDQANEISGRGVGMDVVRKSVEDLKGSVLIDTVLGQGTRFTCRLPLSLDMFNGTIVKVADERYVLSNSEYKETVHVQRGKLEQIGKEDSLLRIEDRVIKIHDLRKILVANQHPSTLSAPNGHGQSAVSHDQVPALVIEYRGVEYGFIVDELLAQEQIVLKRISENMGKVVGAIGCTILGNGQVSLILSLSKIIEGRLGIAA